MFDEIRSKKKSGCALGEGRCGLLFYLFQVWREKPEKTTHRFTDNVGIFTDYNRGDTFAKRAKFTELKRTANDLSVVSYTP